MQSAAGFRRSSISHSARTAERRAEFAISERAVWNTLTLVALQNDKEQASIYSAQTLGFVWLEKVFAGPIAFEERPVLSPHSIAKPEGRN